MAYIVETNTLTFTALNTILKHSNSCIQYTDFCILLEESSNFDNYDFVIHFNFEILMYVSEVIALSVSLPLI